MLAKEEGDLSCVLPPLKKGEERGIYQKVPSTWWNLQKKIPLDPPFSKGETRTATSGVH